MTAERNSDYFGFLFCYPSDAVRMESGKKLNAKIRAKGLSRV